MRIRRTRNRFATNASDNFARDQRLPLNFYRSSKWRAIFDLVGVTQTKLLLHIYILSKKMNKIVSLTILEPDHGVAEAPVHDVEVSFQEILVCEVALQDRRYFPGFGTVLVEGSSHVDQTHGVDQRDRSFNLIRCHRQNVLWFERNYPPIRCFNR